MVIFDHPDFDGHEHVSFFSDPSAGLKMIVAIHRTGPLGTAGGGCRLWPYRSEQEAVRDALRLSRTMTLKLALIEVPAGGAKAVVLGGSKTDSLLAAIGRAVDRLAGRFIIAEDVGTTPADMETVARHTLWVSRQAPRADTATATAYGVLVCLAAAVRRRLGRADLDGISVAVQGLGRVGRALCRELAARGARLVVTDLDSCRVDETVGELGATAVAPEAIFDQAADVFSPCALGDVLDERTVPRLRCSVVSGSANNPLAAPRVADALAARGILYTPDIVANAGGAMAAASGDAPPQILRARLDGLAALLDGVCARAERDGISTQAAAERIARERFAAMAGRP